MGVPAIQRTRRSVRVFEVARRVLDQVLLAEPPAKPGGVIARDLGVVRLERGRQGVELVDPVEAAGLDDAQVARLFDRQLLEERVEVTLLKRELPEERVDEVLLFHAQAVGVAGKPVGVVRQVGVDVLPKRLEIVSEEVGAALLDRVDGVSDQLLLADRVDRHVAVQGYPDRHGRLGAVGDRAAAVESAAALHRRLVLHVDLVAEAAAEDIGKDAEVLELDGVEPAALLHLRDHSLRNPGAHPDELLAALFVGRLHAADDPGFVAGVTVELLGEGLDEILGAGLRLLFGGETQLAAHRVAHDVVAGGEHVHQLRRLEDFRLGVHPHVARLRVRIGGTLVVALPVVLLDHVPDARDVRLLGEQPGVGRTAGEPVEDDAKLAQSLLDEARVGDQVAVGEHVGQPALHRAHRLFSQDVESAVRLAVHEVDRGELGPDLLGDSGVAALVVDRRLAGVPQTGKVLLAAGVEVLVQRELAADEPGHLGVRDLADDRSSGRVPLDEHSRDPGIRVADELSPDRLGNLGVERQVVLDLMLEQPGERGGVVQVDRD